jgi:hypothetical protein
MSDNRPTLTLEKTSGALGRVPKGERITFTFPPEITYEELLPAAYRNLQRIHPDENTMCWEVAA